MSRVLRLALFYRDVGDGGSQQVLFDAQQRADCRGDVVFNLYRHRYGTQAFNSIVKPAEHVPNILGVEKARGR
jgi:hypothetical protein